MSKFRYFKLSEFISSATAKEKGIDNTPDFDEVEHLSELAEVLDSLRAAWGKAVKISSGFRCAQLNKAVGGADTSVHQLGYAADMQTEGEIVDFFDFCKDWLARTRTKFDQLIIESGGGTEWVHLGLYNNAGQQRGKIMKIEK